MKNNIDPVWVDGKLRFLAKQKPITVQFVPDQHFPHNLFFDTYLDMWSNDTPDILILGGDNVNNDPFNHWIKEKPKLLRDIPYPQEYFEFINKEFYKPIRAAVGKKCIIINMLGNHEHWSHKAVEMIPEGKGMFEIENNIESRYVDYMVDCKRTIAIGDMHFSHGDNIPFKKRHHAEKMVTILHRNIMFGHYHDFESYALTTAIDEDRLSSYSVPCSTDINPSSYGKHQPTNRSHGFGSVVILPGGKSFPQIHQIKDGEFVYKDRCYKSKLKKPRKLKYSL